MSFVNAETGTIKIYFRCHMIPGESCRGTEGEYNIGSVQIDDDNSVRYIFTGQDGQGSRFTCSGGIRGEYHELTHNGETIELPVSRDSRVSYAENKRVIDILLSWFSSEYYAEPDTEMPDIF